MRLRRILTIMLLAVLGAGREAFPQTGLALPANATGLWKGREVLIECRARPAEVVTAGADSGEVHLAPQVMVGAARLGAFRVVDGLADPAQASFEAVLKPGSYLRHSGFRLFLAPREDHDLYRQDATFRIEGAPGAEELRLRSANFPDRFIRQQEGALLLHPPGDESFELDAAFLVRDAGARAMGRAGQAAAVGGVADLASGSDSTMAGGCPASGAAIVIEASFDPDRWLGLVPDPGNPSVVLVKLTDKRTDFGVRPALADAPGFLSLESQERPVNYLRHAYMRLHLHPFSQDDIYRKDASFACRAGLADAQAVSFESLNYPGHYLWYDEKLDVWIREIKAPPTNPSDPLRATFQVGTTTTDGEQPVVWTLKDNFALGERVDVYLRSDALEHARILLPTRDDLYKGYVLYIVRVGETEEVVEQHPLGSLPDTPFVSLGKLAPATYVALLVLGPSYDVIPEPPAPGKPERVQQGNWNRPAGKVVIGPPRRGTASNVFRHEFRVTAP